MSKRRKSYILEYTAIMTIYHITSLEAWRQARQEGSYRAGSLEREGFIHCSTREQILPVARRFYAGQTGLVLLAIDPTRLKAEIRYENLEGGETLFPHLYGALNLNAVIDWADFPPGPGGGFEFPAGLE